MVIGLSAAELITYLVAPEPASIRMSAAFAYQGVEKEVTKTCERVWVCE